MVLADPTKPPVVKNGPLFSIRYVIKGAAHRFHEYLIPKVDHVSKKTQQIVKTVYGDMSIALQHFESFVSSGFNHKGEEIEEAELLYGGDLASDNSVVVGAQVLQRIDKDGHKVLLTPPELQPDDVEAADEVEPIDATVDPTASTPGPVIDPKNAHVPNPEATITTTPIDGSPHVEKVIIPVQESGSQLTAPPASDPATTTVDSATGQAVEATPAASEASAPNEVAN